jgi:hypothetical protein
MLRRIEQSLFARRGMRVKAESKGDTDGAPDSGAAENIDFGFLPKSLTSQCRVLIESFHALHGYSCLPDILWKSGLGPFIEAHTQLQALLRKASTTRSAKKSNEGFVKIATTILSLEVLASRFAGWSTIYPKDASRSQAIQKAHARGRHTPLIEFYLYPPKYRNSAAIAALVPPRNIHDAGIDSVPADEVIYGRKAAGHLEAI